MADANTTSHGPNFKDITGQRYGRLIVISYAGIKQDKANWKCLCDCGAEVFVVGSRLRKGETKSCGCFMRDKNAVSARARSYKHGMVGTPEYKAWQSMNARCWNRNSRSYRNYGGRGIRVCKRWSGSDGFARFFEDMGKRPTALHSLERINNNKSYEPSNCVWATMSAQARNKRTNIFIEYDGRKMVLADWAKETGLLAWCITERIRKGWSVELALTTPTKKSHKRKALCEKESLTPVLCGEMGRRVQ